MAEKTLVWSKTAANQVETIYKYWIVRNKSPFYSEKLANQIDKLIETILQNPELLKKLNSPIPGLPH